MDKPENMSGDGGHEVLHELGVWDGSRNVGEVVEEEQNHEEVSLVPEPADYSLLRKKEIAGVIRDLVKENDFRRIDGVLKEVKPILDKLREEERESALQKFMDGGGTRQDFALRPDEQDVIINGTLKLLKERRHQYHRELEDQKAVNLNRKQEVLNNLRSLVDGEDSESGIHSLKQLQQEWKSIGPVPASQLKSLWANYNALIDRYYDHRSIYFELKELDRRKNLEAKLELCGRAERLSAVERINEAVRELNELHHDFKHVGPVPIEDKETIWQRFKAASDAVYERRDAQVATLNLQLRQNQEAKQKLIDLITEYSAFTSDRIKDWNQKTQELLKIQKEWEGVGSVQRSRIRDINKKFWSSFKAFFNNKGQFFRKLDESRIENLKLKKELIEKARLLKDSQDWDKTAEDLKDLQIKWKNTGPVPEKVREKVFREFKETCDYFFEQRRLNFEKEDLRQTENLREKELICEELEKLTKEKSGTLDDLKRLTEKFQSAGYVPKQAMNSIKTRYQKSIDELVSSLEGVGEMEKERAQMEIQLGNLKNDPDAGKKIFQKEQAIRKRITKTENDLAVLRNNLEFFGRSKNAEKYKEEFNGKIQASDQELKQLKAQLKMLRAVLT